MTPDHIATHIETICHTNKPNSTDNVALYHALVDLQNNLHDDSFSAATLPERKRLVKAYFDLANLYLRLAKQHSEDAASPLELPPEIYRAAKIVKPYIEDNLAVWDDNIEIVRSTIISYIPSLATAFLRFLERELQSLETQPDQLRLGPLYVFDFATKTIRNSNDETDVILLSAHLLNYFEFLCANVGRVIHYDEFASAEHIHATSQPAISQSIHNLRKALRTLKPYVDIETRRSVGFMLTITD